MILEIERKTEVLEGCTPTSIPDWVYASDQPLILKGLVNSWPAVQAGLKSDEQADQYLRSFYNGKQVGAFQGGPEIAGRIFYNEDLTGFNYKSERLPLDQVLDCIQQHKQDPAPPTFYVGTATVDACLPGFRGENDLGLPVAKPIVSIWLGNQSRIPCHYDAPHNIACVVAGRRRFTLFPPDQIANLYPGPLDFNPAGQAVSMVDFANPDLQQFPLFEYAVAAGQVAEMEPGDGLFIPSMWWHHVEALDRFNVLVNYWWRNVPDFMGPGVNALKHALLSIRDLPEQERAAWKHIFDYYIFDDANRSVSHIPEHAQGVLAPVDDMAARQLRAFLINRLNR